MKFYVTTKRGKTKVVNAESLNNAESRCNEKYPSWQDIIMADKTKGEPS